MKFSLCNVTLKENYLKIILFFVFTTNARHSQTQKIISLKNNLLDI